MALLYPFPGVPWLLNAVIVLALIGAGVAGAIPPLWGPKSFNTGAGMHRTDTLAAFVRANMPPTAAGTLSEREALDIAAYILGQPRPKFQGNAPQIFQPEPARFF